MRKDKCVSSDGSVKHGWNIDLSQILLHNSAKSTYCASEVLETWRTWQAWHVWACVVCPTVDSDVDSDDVHLDDWGFQDCFFFANINEDSDNAYDD